MPTMPSLYIPHGGGPCFFMDWDPPDTWDRMAEYLRGVPEDIDSRPSAIIVISAHWEERVVTIQKNPAPSLLYDYYGFPDSTYALQYPAPGQPDLSDKVATLLERNGIGWQFDHERGFDHGVFIPLKVVFPDANIPIIQVSLKTGLNPQFHLNLGKALRPLRDDGVLILGSGMSYHNLPRMMSSMRGAQSDADPDSVLFDDWLTVALTTGDAHTREAALVNWEQAPGARGAHPREEHLIPLHVVVGAGGGEQGQRVLKDTVLGGAVSAFQFA